MRGIVLMACSMLVACVGDEKVGTVDKNIADAGGGDGATRGDASTLPSSKLVFISLQVQNSNVLKDLGTACSAELKSRGRGPGFAWAQDTNGRPPTVMLGSYDGPWVLPSGKVVFATKADITGAGAAVPINEHLNGDAVTSGHVWTGVDNKGVSKPDASCNGWTKSTTDLKAAGSTIPTLGANWANDGTLLDCHGQNYLICFEL